MKIVKDIQSAKQSAINVIVITDNGATNILLPLELVSEAVETLNKEGQCPLILADSTYIMAKGLVIGGEEFYKTQRVIMLGGN